MVQLGILYCCSYSAIIFRNLSQYKAYKLRVLVFKSSDLISSVFLRASVECPEDGFVEKQTVVQKVLLHSFLMPQLLHLGSVLRFVVIIE